MIGAAFLYLNVWTKTFDQIAILATLPGPTGFKLTVYLLRSLAFSGFALALLYFTASMARAFLHEGTNLANRIHSLRFGRLYIYLKYGSVEKEGLDKLRRALKVSDLEEAFGWNIETSTAFKDMKTELMARNALVSALESVARIAKEVRATPEKEAAKANES